MGPCLMEGVGLGASLGSLDPVGKWRPHGAIIHQIGGSQLEAACRLATPEDILILVAAKGTTSIHWVEAQEAVRHPPALARQWRVLVNQACPILCDPVNCSPPGSSVRGIDSPGKNTGVSRHFLFRGIFPTQGSNLGLPHYGQILYI